MAPVEKDGVGYEWNTSSCWIGVNMRYTCTCTYSTAIYICTVKSIHSYNANLTYLKTTKCQPNIGCRKSTLFPAKIACTHKLIGGLSTLFSCPQLWCGGGVLSPAGWAPVLHSQQQKCRCP